MSEQEPLDKQPKSTVFARTGELTSLAHVFTGNDIRVTYDPQEKEAYFRADPPEIVLGGALAQELGMNEEEEMFVKLHEVGHFHQFLSDPRTFEGISDSIEKKAQGNPLLTKIWERFYNAFLDIHSNALVQKKSRVFHPENREMGDVPYAFYKYKAYKGSDYSGNPLTAQFCDYLLRRMMVPDEAVAVSPEVREQLDKSVTLYRREYPDLEAFVRDTIFNGKTPLSHLYYYLDQFVIPSFKELLEQDEKNSENLTKEQFADPTQSMDATDMKNFEGAKRYADEKQKPANKRAEEVAQQRFDDKNKKQGYTQEERETMEKRRARTREGVSALKEIWELMIHRSYGVTTSRESGYKTGSSLNMSDLIAQIPIILTNPSEAQFMERATAQEISTDFHPQIFNLIVHRDCSGSVFNNNQVRFDAITDQLHSLAESLILFIKEVNYNSGGKEIPLQANVVWVDFGDSVIIRIKEGELTVSAMSDDSAFQKAEDMLWNVSTRQFKNLNGNSADDKGLEEARTYIQKFKTEHPRVNALNLSLFITDGGTGTEETLKKIKEALIKEGAYSRAIQIDEQLNEGEVKSFERVWGKEGARAKTLPQLKQVAKKLFADIMNTIT
ncbi:hypothetical protein HGA88_02860 [Candidatus Roizmanbacteria bacterium]|nr:hypothetical protein [Candidatus Roizmanbacteria bacterium]